jgi:hypothetical protein
MMRMIRSFEFQFCVMYLQSLVQYGACAPPDSKMATEVVGKLTHADAPQRGNAPHGIPHAFITLYNIYTYEIILAGNS